VLQAAEQALDLARAFLGFGVVERANAVERPSGLLEPRPGGVGVPVVQLERQAKEPREAKHPITVGCVESLPALPPPRQRRDGDARSGGPDLRR